MAEPKATQGTLPEIAKHGIKRSTALKISVGLVLMIPPVIGIVLALGTLVFRHIVLPW